jgi:hypothetical protein
MVTASAQTPLQRKKTALKTPPSRVSVQVDAMGCRAMQVVVRLGYSATIWRRVWRLSKAS